MIQKSGLKRNTIDKYYTNNDIADKCIKILLETNIININSYIIEPSAGNGSFVKVFEKMNYNITSYDIQPEYKNIIKADFLTTKLEMNKDIHFIGNPPFGRQSSLAKKFIKKCCIHGNSISFILPKSFKKDSMIRCFNMYFHKIKEIDLEPKSFSINEKAIDVPCVFQIWQKKDIKRLKPKKYNPIKFNYTKDINEADYALRRVGINAGNIFSDNLDEKSKQSHNFIILDKSIDKILFEKEYSNIIFMKNNTVGPRSISKNEFNKEINNIISNLN